MILSSETLQIDWRSSERKSGSSPRSTLRRGERGAEPGNAFPIPTPDEAQRAGPTCAHNARKYQRRRKQSTWQRAIARESVRDTLRTLSPFHPPSCASLAAHSVNHSARFRPSFKTRKVAPLVVPTYRPHVVTITALQIKRVWPVPC